jgi:hypothetical protein
MTKQMKIDDFSLCANSGRFWSYIDFYILQNGKGTFSKANLFFLSISSLKRVHDDHHHNGNLSFLPLFAESPLRSSKSNSLDIDFAIARLCFILELSLARLMH